MTAFRGEMTAAFSPAIRAGATRHKSRRVGPARDGDGQPTTAYRALEGLMCGRCGGDIAVGELVVRRAVSLMARHGRGLTQAPVCARCRPLTVIEGRQQDG
jgi:hypothetical protein